MKLASRLRNTVGNWKTIAILGIAYGVSQAIIGSILHPLGTSTVLELQTTLSVETFSQIIEQWRTAGMLDTYWRHYLLDFIHPALYGGFLAAMLAKGFDLNNVDARHDNALLVPVIAGALDLVENLCHVAMLTTPSNINAPLVVLGGTAANLKWLLVLGSLVSIAFFFLRGLRRTEVS